MKPFWAKSLLHLCWITPLFSSAVMANLPVDDLGKHEILPSRQEAHIVTISDPNIPHTIDGRVHFVDVDRGRYLGALNTGYWYGGVVLPKTRNEIISPETHFSRGTHGKRSDVVTFYDPKTLQPTGEVLLPSKRATTVKAQGVSALSDDEKFLLVLNLTPATSISVVDLDQRRFVAEIETPGCTQIYAVGNRDFNVVCADGSFMGIQLDDQGQLQKQIRRDPVFDPAADPITAGGARLANTWYHLSREGYVHAFTTRDGNVTAAPTWSLVSQDERDDNWRIAGLQHLAIHQDSRRLYALMIQGGPEQFEDPTDQVWVYDLDSHKRVQVIELEHPALWMNISQGPEAQLYAVGVDLQIPFLFSLWLYFAEGREYLTRLATMSFDTYELASGDLQHSLPRIGKLPNLIQPWQ
jgi:methylamine dehydrogenase heavy chain